MKNTIFAFINKTSKGYVLQLRSSFDLSVNSYADLVFDLKTKKEVNTVVKTYGATKWNF
jgi:hypothetical protein